MISILNYMNYNELYERYNSELYEFSVAKYIIDIPQMRIHRLPIITSHNEDKIIIQ